jgi:ammonium transporter, Amt family
MNLYAIAPAGNRASAHDEAIGMDIVEHGEEAYASGEGAVLVRPEEEFKARVPVADPG